MVDKVGRRLGAMGRLARLPALFYRLMVGTRRNRSETDGPGIVDRLQTAGGFHSPDCDESPALSS